MQTVVVKKIRKLADNSYVSHEDDTYKDIKEVIKENKEKFIYEHHREECQDVWMENPPEFITFYSTVRWN